MNLNCLLNSLKFWGLFSAVYFLLTTPGQARVIPEKSKQKPSVSSQEQYYFTSAVDLLAQQNTSIVRVTGINLNPTETGLQVILETPIGQRLQPLIFPDNKTLIIDILDAVLALPESEEFRQTNPAEGISEVTVRPLDATSIRITITG
ncbi:AMIN domain-containing protein, partial [Pleurocapsales cyanobacterium LEGE 06147]|nr:AMIN domain-containing protein [Pleurocapsales cyanobacterium LEGE 06147]